MQLERTIDKKGRAENTKKLDVLRTRTQRRNQRMRLNNKIALAVVPARAIRGKSVRGIDPQQKSVSSIIAWMWFGRQYTPYAHGELAVVYSPFVIRRERAGK